MPSRDLDRRAVIPLVVVGRKHEEGCEHVFPGLPIGLGLGVGKIQHKFSEVKAMRVLRKPVSLEPWLDARHRIDMLDVPILVIGAFRPFDRESDLLLFSAPAIVLAVVLAEGVAERPRNPLIGRKGFEVARNHDNVAFLVYPFLIAPVDIDAALETFVAVKLNVVGLDDLPPATGGQFLNIVRVIGDFLPS